MDYLDTEVHPDLIPEFVDWVFAYHRPAILSRSVFTKWVTRKGFDFQRGRWGKDSEHRLRDLWPLFLKQIQGPADEKWLEDMEAISI